MEIFQDFLGKSSRSHFGMPENVDNPQVGQPLGRLENGVREGTEEKKS